MRKLKNILFLSSILIFLVAFNFSDNSPSNWTRQTLPDIGGRQVLGMNFKDTLTGYIVTSIVSDTSYFLKTTDGGENWSVKYKGPGLIFNSIQFLNTSTGYISGTSLLKTTNGGENWSIASPLIYSYGICALNTDTLWYTNPNSFNGGIYRTTNGGANWTLQLSAGSESPNFVYFYNRNLGFAGRTDVYTRFYRTTNAGASWDSIKMGPVTDMHFINNLTGWMCDNAPDSSMQKTTDGGLTWKRQRLPHEGGPFLWSRIINFTALNKDTLWGVGGTYNYGSGRFRALIYKTTNGGENWGYQIPDTSFQIIGQLLYVNFTDKTHGWAFNGTTGVRTITGGDDTTIFVGIKQISSEIPADYKLLQNFPNPFNPVTIINYQLTINSFVKLKIYNLQEKEVAVLVNQKQNAGMYSVDFDANKYSLSTGIYFYTLQTDNFKETKKMILVK